MHDEYSDGMEKDTFQTDKSEFIEPNDDLKQNIADEDEFSNKNIKDRIKFFSSLSLQDKKLKN